MPEPTLRVNVTLKGEQAAKLSQLASRMHLQEGTLARLLLTTAVDEADASGRQITDLLNRIPGAWEDAEEGLAEVRRGEGIALDQF